jgi:hypothetical protein
MQRPMSTMLLEGAKKRAGRLAMGIMATVIVAAPLAAPLTAQDASSAAKQEHSAAAGNLDLAVAYNATRSNMTSGSSFWLQGGSAEIAGRVDRCLGAVADIAGMHAANINSSGAGLDLIAATFGPRYTWSRHNYAVYGQGLVGEAWGTNGIFPNSTGANTTADGLAIEAGGGINIAVSRHVTLRAFEANWLRTQLPNSTSNVQNNLRLGAGFVFHLR